jgi:hypothetical protein
LEAGKNIKTLFLPLTVLELGEYNVHVKISLNTQRGKLVRIKIFSILAQDGLVWFGLDSLDNAVRSKVKNLIHLGTITASQFNDTVDNIKRERTIKARKNALKILNNKK